MKKLLFVLLLSVCAHFSFADSKLIEANDTHFLYTGRIDFSNKKAPTLSWPGTSIKANFTGSQLEIVLDDQLGKNFFAVIIDGEDIFPYVIEAKQGEQSYRISSTLGEGKHTVEIYKRTEGEEGRTAFKGIKIDESAHLLKAPKRPTRRIEIFGDSITSGMANEGADNGLDHLVSEKNNYWAYGSIAARSLNAELHTTSQSGIGIMISWFPFIMPDFYDQLDAVGNNDSQWDFSQWIPDLVLVNLFQNDSWLIDDKKRLQPLPSDEERVQAYINFVEKIRAVYPKAYIVCALGSMDATSNEKWPNYIREAVNIMRTKGDKKLDTLFFDFNGFKGHPRIAQHKHNAEKLVSFVHKKLGW